MSLQVWLPLNGDLHNQGLSNIIVGTNNNNIFQLEGKLGNKSLDVSGTFVFTVPELVKTNIFSLAFWYKPISDSSATDNWRKIIVFNTLKADLTTAGSPFRLESSYGYQTSNTAYAISIHNNTGYEISSIGQGLASGWDVWQHIAVTADGTTLKCYRNGELLVSKTMGTGFLSGKISIGYAGNKPIGRLNDFRLYDHCLSAKEVEEIAKGLVLHYKLDSIPNPNLFTSIKSHNPTQYLGYQLYISEKLTTDTYTMQLWDVDVSHTGKTEAELGLGVYWGGGNVHLKTLNGTKYFTNGHADYLCFQITPTSGQVSNSEASNLWLNIYNSPGSKSGTKNMSIGAWKLEKGTIATPLDFFGTTIYDSSGYNNNGTIVGNLTAAAGSPRYDVATDFPASGTNYIRIGTQLYDVKDEMTISLWAKANDWTSTAKGTPFSSVEAGGFGWQVSNANYVFYCGTGTSSNTYVSSAVAVSGLSAGWHMLSATYDGLALRVYIDGELKNTVSKYTTKTPIFYNNSSGMFISGESSGNVTSPNGSIFRGSISDVRIYATALTADQIKEFYTTSMSIDSRGNVYAREFKEQ